MNQTIYPIGIQNFEKIRKDGYLYIDKTALVYQLVTTGQYYFLSRPRRFGKSLLLSTLEAYFQGKKELFEGLAMEKLEMLCVCGIPASLAAGTLCTFGASALQVSGRLCSAAFGRGGQEIGRASCRERV